MANNILSIIWNTDQHWSYYYLLIGILLLIICFLLYRLKQLKKNTGKEKNYYHSLFDILDNLPFPIMVKDIQDSFRLLLEQRIRTAIRYQAGRSSGIY